MLSAKFNVSVNILGSTTRVIVQVLLFWEAPVTSIHVKILRITSAAGSPSVLGSKRGADRYTAVKQLALRETLTGVPLNFPIAGSQAHRM